MFVLLIEPPPGDVSVSHRVNDSQPFISSAILPMTQVAMVPPCVLVRHETNSRY